MSAFSSITQTRFSPRLMMFLLLATPLAVDANDFEIDWWTVDGGGTLESEQEGWSLAGTIGQWDAAGQIASGEKWTLQGGFWGFEMPDRDDRLFRDRFELVPKSAAIFRKDEQ
ncbi:MAG: hypothetical protein V2J42_12850 [Wenzhouxiangella sp.]|jgi:hypothetical protein|nr:hypothetical protein [Wenzhouxiangella sp.]